MFIATGLGGKNQLLSSFRKDGLDMSHPTAFHQLGRFIVMFQNLEAGINEFIYLITDVADDPAVAGLTFTKRLDATDELFADFIEAQGDSDHCVKAEFSHLVRELKALTDRRNVLVHSRFSRWLNVEGREGLLRTSTRINGSKRKNDDEEELQPEAFDGDLGRLQVASEDLNRFRLRVIDLLYPDVS